MSKARFLWIPAIGVLLLPLLYLEYRLKVKHWRKLDKEEMVKFERWMWEDDLDTILLRWDR